MNLDSIRSLFRRLPENASRLISAAVIGVVSGLSAVAFMLEHSFVDKDRQQGPHGGITGRTGNILLNFLRGRLIETIHCVHDLALAAGEVLIFGSGSHGFGWC